MPQVFALRHYFILGDMIIDFLCIIYISLYWYVCLYVCMSIHICMYVSYGLITVVLIIIPFCALLLPFLALLHLPFPTGCIQAVTMVVSGCCLAQLAVCVAFGGRTSGIRICVLLS